MSAQKDGWIYVYDVDGEGACVMHFATQAPEGFYVNLGESVMHPKFFRAQQAMHQRMGHTLVLEEESYGRSLWTVRVGRGDFLMMLQAIQMALEGIPGNTMNGGFNASQN